MPVPLTTLFVDGRIILEEVEANIITHSLTMRDSATIECVVVIIGTNYTDRVKHHFQKSETEAKYFKSYSKTIFLYKTVTFLFFLIPLIL